MKWIDNGGRYLKAAAGHLFAYIAEIEAYKTPGHPDYEPTTYEWFIAPDDEDKNYRRALAGGERLPTLDAAKLKVEEALHRILAELASALESAP